MGSISLPTLHVLNFIAIICTAVIYGTDVFFALVGKSAAAKSKESSIADYLGHIHSYADKRMPIIGILAIVTTIAQIILYGIHTLAGQSAIASLIGLFLQLFFYFKIAKPVNSVLTDAIKHEKILTNIRQLQERWDSVIGWRALSLTLAMTGLILINYVN